MSRKNDVGPVNSGESGGGESRGSFSAAQTGEHLRTAVHNEMSGVSDFSQKARVFSGAAPTTESAFSPRQSVAELVKSGSIKDVQRPGEQTLEFPDLSDKTPPKISVSFDKGSDSPNPPTFLVRNDGSIEMNGDPEKLNTKNISVQVERSEGQIYPTPEQQAQLDKLMTYLSQRLKAQNAELDQKGVEVNDTDSLISPQTRQREGMRQPAENSGNSPETQQSIGNMNRFRGGNGGEMPVRDTNQYYPDRDVPRQTNESDQQAAVKEAVAGLFNSDRAHPYETVRRHPSGDHRVGRYGFSGHQLMDWLNGLDLGDPPDPAKIAELIKQGKLPKGFNAASLQKLKAMASNMEKGGAPTADDMQSLPKELQETIATDMVKQFSERLGNNPGAIAAGFVSGKTPAEVTQADLNSPSGKQMAEAGQRLYDIANVRQQSTQPNETMKWTGEGRVSIGDGKWLNSPAAQALAAAKADAAAHGVTININSAGRTFEQQQDLYNRRGTAGVSSVVARPGTSNHESGNALDVQNYAQAKPYLLKYGFVHGDGRGPIANDLVHFKFVGNTRNA